MQKRFSAEGGIPLSRQVPKGLTGQASGTIHAPARGATDNIGPTSYRHIRFNPRARTGRDSVRSLQDWAVGSFNPRARTGRDRGKRNSSLCSSQFQSTRPHGARLQLLPLCTRGCSVSIHAPARGATLIVTAHDLIIAGFNPRARTGRDFLLPRGGGNETVSIHAPARGATR